MGDATAIPSEPDSVGVVIPTHNRPDTLLQALDSVLAQELPPTSVVIVDDASTPPISTWLPHSDPRLLFLRNDQPLGPAVARNQGVAALTTEWIAFLDDDDRWLPNKLSRCLHCVDLHPEVDLVVHRAATQVPRERSEGQSRLIRDPVPWMLMKQPPHVNCVLVRRSTHERVKFDESFLAAADLDYMVRLGAASRVIELPEVLAVHGSDGTPSAITIDRRIAARLQFHAKHLHLFHDPHLEATHRVRLGHLNRRAGHPLRALRAFASAISVRPSHLSAWKGIASVWLPGRVTSWISNRGA